MTAPLDCTTIRVRGDDEVARAITDARAEGRVLRIRGAGTWMDAGSVTRPCDVLDLSDDRGIVRYEPGDLTITARAGTTLAELDDALRTHEQMLALDPDGARHATIGATVATCSWGPSAAAYGTPRDRVLGMTVVLGTGDVVHAGGRVVKNVAGFDLVRLFTGSWGWLGVITELTLRVSSRSAARGAFDHMKRASLPRTGHREPVLVHPALELALKHRFDPSGVLNPGIMSER